MDDIFALSAVEQAQRIANKELSSLELTLGYLRRIAQRNHELNAFVQVSERRSARRARMADRASPVSPLHGVPTAIKDLNAVRGMFQRAGSLSLKWYMPPFDDLVVRRVKAAGMPILGKLATSELGTMPVTEPLAHAPTLNPIDPRYSAGGSSGGSAAAVGAGLLPIAHGSDGAGSLRIPAAFCGLVGFKPSRGLIPNPHAGTDKADLACNGPIARHVRDAAAFIDVLADTKGDMLRACSAPVPKQQVFLCTDVAWTSTDAEHAAAAERVAKILEGLGHSVRNQAWLTASPSEFLPVWQRQTALVPLLSDKSLHPFTAWLRAAGKPLRDADVKAIADGLKQRVGDWVGAGAVWVSPTTPNGPPLVGALNLSVDRVFAAMAPIGAFTAAFNIGGQPAISIPVGRNRAGLPIGVQIAGPVGSDALVLSLACAVERVLQS